MSNTLISIIWFAFLYGGLFFLYKKNDLFSPIKFICLLYIFRNVLFLIAVYLDEDVFPRDILAALDMSLDEALPQYLYVQTIAFISLIFGINFIKRTKFRNQQVFFNHPERLVITSNIIFLMGLSGYILFFIQVGGISILLNNLNNRVALQSGGYSLIFAELLTIGIIFRIRLLKFNHKRNKFWLAVFIVFAVFLSSSLGGRKNTVFLLLMIIITFHFYVKPIVISQIKKGRIAFLAIFLIVYTFIIPILRSPNGLDKLLTGQKNVFEEIELGGLITYFSYTWIDIYTTNHFNDSNKWDFYTLLTIPSNFNVTIPNVLRPPVDEGVYLYNSIFYNTEFKPLTARNKMIITSYPIENMGFGYANYLIPGVILAFFLLGIFYKMAYNFFLKHYNHPLALYFYMSILINFNFSSLRIINLIYTCINIFLVFIVMRFLQIKEKRSKVVVISSR